MDGIVVWVACGLVAAGMVCDLRARRIPNAIPLALLGLFAVYAALGGAGPRGALWVHVAIAPPAMAVMIPRALSHGI